MVRRRDVVSEARPVRRWTAATTESRLTVSGQGSWRGRLAQQGGVRTRVRAPGCSRLATRWLASLRTSDVVSSQRPRCPVTLRATFLNAGPDDACSAVLVLPVLAMGRQARTNVLESSRREPATDKENPDGKADCDHTGHARRCRRPGRRVGATGRGPRRVLVRASGEIQRAGAGPHDLRGAGGILAESIGQVGRHGQPDAEVRRIQHPVRRARVERNPARGRHRRLDPEAQGRGRR